MQNRCGITLPTKPLSKSYLHGASCHPLETLTLAEALENTAVKYPQKEAMIYYSINKKKDVLVFEEWQSKSRKIGAALKKLGINRGDNVAILAPNCNEFLIAAWGVLYIGATVVCLSYELKSGEDIFNKLSITKCRGLFIYNDNNPMTKQVLERLMNCDKGWYRYEYATPVVVTIGITFDGTKSYDQLLSISKQADVDDVIKNMFKQNCEDIAFIALTSGSTGAPKTVPINHQSILNAYYFSCKLRGGMDEGSIFFNDGPFTWLGGLMLPVSVVRLGVTGVSIHTSATVSERQTDFTLKCIKSERCTHIMAMAYLMYDIIKSDSEMKYSITSLETIFIGGQKVPINLVEGMRDVFKALTVVNLYGASEIGGAVVTTDICDPLVVDGRVTVGFPIPHAEVKLIDENGYIVPINQPGEVCLRGHNWVSKAFQDEHGWFHTGDIGEMDSAGRLYIFGRCKDMIKRGTLSIVTGPLEQTLATNESIEGVYVVGVPDERLYEEICACIEVKPGANLTAEDMRNWCDEVFTAEGTADGKSMAPKYFVFVDSFPLRPNGKLDRIQLRATAMKQLHLPYISDGFAHRDSNSTGLKAE
ncbi:unnamed protein product [Owenia fusiformis]|uniref:Uncharacterized protein n=1 Tax=Owenia fusiformis TaxID=6347 RepID=A0A8S4N606_OWEFU|nr:unnamed protein product [Owenia fusiformis]